MSASAARLARQTQGRVLQPSHGASSVILDALATRAQTNARHAMRAPGAVPSARLATRRFPARPARSDAPPPALGRCPTGCASSVNWDALAMLLDCPSAIPALGDASAVRLEGAWWTRPAALVRQAGPVSPVRWTVSTVRRARGPRKVATGATSAQLAGGAATRRPPTWLRAPTAALAVRALRLARRGPMPASAVRPAALGTWKVRVSVQTALLVGGP
mmetsp:Transcript_16714/g.39704  ORF Transcript_16714/g.39704 Transcript_16714/m.39704 type:complete len:218 (-) Transcript_16714:10-663(-)